MFITSCFGISSRLLFCFRKGPLMRAFSIGEWVNPISGVSLSIIPYGKRVLCHASSVGGSLRRLTYFGLIPPGVTHPMQTSYNGIPVPANGTPIEYANGKFTIPDHPIIPFIEGDGTGRDIWKASVRVFDAAVDIAYGGKRRVSWYEVFAGEKAMDRFKTWLPDETVAAFRDLRIGIKGPLTTPVGGGIRSLNVALRQILDLYACVRPVKYYQGIPSPVKSPHRMNMVIFRENTEDVYAGIEWKEGTAQAKELIDFLNNKMLAGTNKRIREDSGVGIKPISITGNK